MSALGTLVVFGLMAIVFVAAIVGMIWSELRKSPVQKKKQGVEPGQGGTIAHGGLGSGENSHASAIVVPRDPQAYAKGMMPGRKGRKR